MKTRISILLLSALLGLTACSVNDDNPVDEPATPSVTTAPEPDYASVATGVPVFVSASIKPEVMAAMQTFLTNITSIDEAEVAVVRDEDIGTYEGKLLDLYQRGGLVVVAQPVGDHFKEFAGKYGLPNLVPFDASQEVMLYATSKAREHYVLYAANPFDFGDDEDPLLASLYTEDLQTYYKRRLFNIFGWMKQQREAQSRTRGITTLVTTFDPKIVITDCDKITHNFSVTMNHCVCDLKGFLYTDEYIYAETSVEVTNFIYSFYVFEANKNPGEYYIIRSEATAYNTPGWQPFDHNHAGVVTKGAGYFMSEYDVTSQVTDDKKKNLSSSDIEIFITPTPGTTEGSKTVSVGSKVGVSGSLCASAETLGSVGFSAERDESESMTLKDVSIALETKPSNGMVKYKYTVENVTSRDWSSTKAMENDVPKLARSNFSAKSMWCWRIKPSEATGLKDNSDIAFLLKNDVKYVYDCMIESNFSMFYTRHHKWTFTDATYTALPHPSRVPFGLIEITNLHPIPIAHIRLWKQGGTIDPKNPDLSIENGIGADKSLKFPLGVGTYTMEYDQLDPSTNQVQSSWRITDIVIKNGADETKSTTTVTTTSATQK